MSTGQVKGKNARGRECEQGYRERTRARRAPVKTSRDATRGCHRNAAKFRMWSAEVMQLDRGKRLAS